jgi:hypothetical protein
MRVFIPKGKNNLFISNEIITENTYAAFFGFSVMGWEVVFYEGEPPTGLHREDIVVGFITQVKQALINLNIEPPTEIDYPEELQVFLQRKVWKDSLHRIYTTPEAWPVFVKPVKGKQFDGKLIESLKDLIGIGSQEDRQIWCSEPCKFISEYRCFIKYDKVIDVRRYKGDYKIFPNLYILERCLEEYKNPPNAYTIDIGVASTGETKLIEVNDGYAMGSYGLTPVEYAKMISARWSQLTDTPDRCLF